MCKLMGFIYMIVKCYSMDNDIVEAGLESYNTLDTRLLCCNNQNVTLAWVRSVTNLVFAKLYKF